MNICIFPGTFNPIHIGHIKMAQFVLDNFNFEKIIFIPAYIPPHKQLSGMLAKHRYNMVKIACAKNNRFEVSDIEYKTEGKSYTINTVIKIKEMYGINGRLNFIIGADAFLKIKTWYKADELKNLVHFIVFPRGEYIISKEEFSTYDYEFIDAEKIDISSTELRNRNKVGLIEEIEEYIVKNELYN